FQLSGVSASADGGEASSGWHGDLGRRQVWNLDVDGERRDLVAAIDLHLDLVRVDRDVTPHHRQDLLPQHRDQVGLTDQTALVFQQDLQPLARDRRGAAAAPGKIEETHAALRPNSLSSSPFLSLGMDMAISSPQSRLAAST